MHPRSDRLQLYHQMLISTEQKSNTLCCDINILQIVVSPIVAPYFEDAEHLTGLRRYELVRC